jgi:hypothetical protein
MPALDIFNNDAFSVMNLTQAINDQPHQPTRLGEMGLFESSGISTTSLMVERKGNTLQLVQTSPRGSIGASKEDNKRKVISINTVHLQRNDAIVADKVQNVRAFGSESELQTVQSIVNEKLGELRRDMDLTLEWHRMGALKGLLLDADGSTLMDSFATFNLVAQTHDLVLDNDATKVKVKVVEAIRKMEAALGAKVYTGVHVLCSSEFFDAFVSHPAVVASYERWLDGAFLRDDQRASGFEFCKCTFEEYRGQVGATRFIAANKAHMFPKGVMGMYKAHYAPADYMETVNTIGVPYYAKQELMRMGKGVEVEAQTNPIFFNTQPDAVIELSI